MTAPPAPPAHLEPYVRILGLKGAVAFFLSFGGGELYLPVRANPPAKLVEVVGAEPAAALCQAAARLPKRVPTAKPWVAAVFRAEGLSVTEIARRLHVSDVTVRGWLGPKAGKREPPSDPRQMRLI